ncbi:MAG: hypothetical protein H0T62_00715 [Parachlamydiaceae bacterium]|nr:hypothetical protein [Parachlamydiaceae bacterium]
MNNLLRSIDANEFISKKPPNPGNKHLYLEKVENILDSDWETLTKIKNIKILTEKLASLSVNLNAFDWGDKVTFRLASFECIESLFSKKGNVFENAIEMLKLGISLILSDGQNRHIKQGLKLLSSWNAQEIGSFKNLLHLKKIATQMNLSDETDFLQNALYESNLEVAVTNAACRILHDAKLMIEKGYRNSSSKYPNHKKDWDVRQHEAVGNLFLSFLFVEKEKEIWDFFHYPTLAIKLLQFPRIPEQVQRIASLFQAVSRDLKTVILESLSKIDNIAELIRKLDSLHTRYEQNTPRFIAIMSQIYPFQTNSPGSDNALVWIDSINGQGFLIGCFGPTKFLFNTADGIVDTGPGAPLDIVLLEKRRDGLLFKILKRDGWILFDTKKQPNHEYFDSIQLVSDAPSQGARKVLVKRCKEKLIIFFGRKKIIIDGIEAGHIYGNKVPFLAIKLITNLWGFVNLESETICSLLHTTFIQPVQGTTSFAEGGKEGGGKALFYLDNLPKEVCIIPNTDQVLFSNFDEGVFVKNDKDLYREITREGKINNLSPNLYHKLETFHITDRRLQIKSYGVTISDKGVRYEFEMELQGRYYITKCDITSVLSFYTTVTMNTLEMIKSNGDISLLGISRRFQDAPRAYFLITDEGKSLYVSRYSELKSKADKGKEIKGCGVLHKMDCEKILYLFDSYFALLKENCWRIYEDDIGLHCLEFESVSNFGSSRYLKVQQKGLFYAYDLEAQKILPLDGAQDVRLNASDNLIFIYPNYIRHFRLNYLPDILQSDFLETFLDKEDEVVRYNYECNILKFPEFNVSQDNLDSPFVQFLLSRLDYELLRQLCLEHIQALETVFTELQQFAQFDSLLLNHIVKRLIRIPQENWKEILDGTINFFTFAKREQILLPPQLLLIFDLAQLNHPCTEALLRHWANENRLETTLAYYFGLKVGQQELFVMHSYGKQIKSYKQLEKFLNTLLIWQELKNGSPYIMETDFSSWQTSSGEEIYTEFSNKLMLDHDQTEKYQSHRSEWDLETLPDLWYAFNVMDDTHRGLMKYFVASNQVDFQLKVLLEYDNCLTKTMSEAGFDISKFNREHTQLFYISSAARSRAEALNQIVNVFEELIKKLPGGKSFNLNANFTEIQVPLLKKKRVSKWEVIFENQEKTNTTACNFFCKIKNVCTEVLTALASQIEVPSHSSARVNNLCRCFDTREFILQIWNRKPSSCLPLGRFAESCLSLDRPQRSAMIDYLADRSVEIFPLIEKTLEGIITWGYTRMVLGLAMIGGRQEKCVLIDSIELNIKTKDEAKAAKENILKMSKTFAISIGADFVLISPKWYPTSTSNPQTITFTKMGGCPFDRIYLYSFFSTDESGWIQKSVSGEVKGTSEFLVLRAQES